MHIDDILDELAYSDDFPEAAIRWSLANPSKVVPEFIKILREAAVRIHLSEEEELSLLFIVHILADLRETKAFQIIVSALASNNEDLIGALFGEDRETVPQVLISTYDGDEQALRSLVENAVVDEFIRDQAFHAWGYLVADGQIDRDTAHEYLVRTFDALEPQTEHMIWSGWLINACNLGFEDLLPRALTIFGDGRMPEKLMDEPYLHNEMALGVAAKDRAQMYQEQQIYPFSDVIESLSEWASFREVAYEDTSPHAAFLHPVQNDFRGVGRNDPCPCGSGKKFKKCCLH